MNKKQKKFISDMDKVFNEKIGDIITFHIEENITSLSVYLRIGEHELDYTTDVNTPPEDLANRILCLFTDEIIIAMNNKSNKNH